jgi:regulator of protease activity HflC (stomatin/prohibitin superfamily)
VKVSVVEVKDVELPQGMQRAMARQAEAERERRAKIINADGELQASERLAEAGRIMSEDPATLQLRLLQTLSEIATEKNSTIVLPVPFGLFEAIQEAAERSAANPDMPRRVRVRAGGNGGGDVADDMAPPSIPPPPLTPEGREGTVS